MAEQLPRTYTVAEAADLLGRKRSAFYEHIRRHGPVINGIAVCALIHGQWACFEEAIERVRRGEYGSSIVRQGRVVQRDDQRAA